MIKIKILGHWRWPVPLLSGKGVQRVMSMDRGNVGFQCKRPCIIYPRPQDGPLLPPPPTTPLHLSTISATRSDCVSHLWGEGAVGAGLEPVQLKRRGAFKVIVAVAIVFECVLLSTRMVASERPVFREGE